MSFLTRKSNLIGEFVILLMNIFLSSSQEMYRCCPFNTQLKINNENSKTSFTCHEIINDNSTTTSDDEMVNAGAEFLSFSYREDDEFHFPSCDLAKMFHKPIVGESVSVSSANCVDLIGNQYHVVYCRNHFDTKVDIINFRKCCPKAHIYDHSARECIHHIEGAQNFSNLIKNELNVFTTGPPICDLSSDDVVVEYESSKHHLSFDNMRLKINGSAPKFGIKSYCIENTRNEKWIAQVCQKKAICNDIPCVRKCCNFGEKLYKSDIESPAACVPDSKAFNPEFYVLGDFEDNMSHSPKEISVFGFLQSHKCLKTLNRSAVFLNYKDGHMLHEHELISHSDYCIETVTMPDNETEVKPFLCIPGDYDVYNNKIQFMAYGLTFSCCFMLATIIVYLCLPKLCNLHGKTLLANLISSLSAYSSLAYVQFYVNGLPPMCRALSFVIYFSFLSAFSWMNVMCFDMYMKIRSVAPKTGIPSKHKDLRRLFIYAIYAVGFPAFMTTLTYFVDTNHLIHEDYMPNMGGSNCWFAGYRSPGRILFFITPVGFQIIVNCLLFILTAIYCNRVKNEIQDREDTKEKGKIKIKFTKNIAKVKLIVKLFIVMGISWIFEIAATFYYMQEYLFRVSDAFNTLQGVFIFIIFVCKRNIYQKLLEKFGYAKRPQRMDTTMTTINSTSGSMSVNCVDPYSAKYGKLPRNESKSPSWSINSRRIVKESMVEL